VFPPDVTNCRRAGAYEPERGTYLVTDRRGTAVAILDDCTTRDDANVLAVQVLLRDGTISVGKNDHAPFTVARIE
jgi:hypothetical protein